ncbi:MAG: type II toxin-antitoxin system VapC family toxin [candidate division KSB1 bacterium]|nr:type II toxin-antitoxin system VapC family toxin [candidate division KSB1 bacterium]
MVLSKIILDTSAHSAFMRGEPRAVEAVQLAGQIFIPQIVVGELAYSFEAGTKKQKNWQVFYRFLDSPRVEVVDIDFDTALYYARVLAQLLKNGTPIPTNDIWIAASCLRHSATLLTRDPHFEYIEGLIRFMLTE